MSLLHHQRNESEKLEKESKEPLTMRMVKEYQRRLSMMNNCQRATQDNRLKLIKELSNRCCIKFCDASCLVHGKDIDAIMEKYCIDTSETRDVRSTEEIF